MEALFPAMVQSLTTATKNISGFNDTLSDQEWDEYADVVSSMQAGLIQLNSVLFFNYGFEDGIPADIINYTALLQEYETACGEKIGYLLGRYQFFKPDTYEKYNTIFLEEVISGITYNSNIISNLTGS